jgi:hypothetical protein
MELSTKNQDMMNAFAEERPDPSALVPLNLGNTQIEQRPVGAIKVAVERDEAKVLQRLRVFSQAAGEDFYYRFPVKVKIKLPDGREEWGQDWIEGPSIKCALAVARAYGNCDVDVRTQDGGDFWVFYARFQDFETGFSITRAFQQRKSQKTMKTDSARALDIVFQIGQSKSIRNVVCNALGMFTDFAFMEARQAIVDKVGKNLEQYRTKVLQRLTDMKIDVSRVASAVGRTADKWLAPDIARIIAEIQAVNDGMAAAEDLYPLLGGPEQKPERPDFTNGNNGKPAEKPKERELTEEETREADRLTRAAMQGETEADPLADMQDELTALANCRTIYAVDRLGKQIGATIAEQTEKLVAWDEACSVKANEILAKKK